MLQLPQAYIEYIQVYLWQRVSNEGEVHPDNIFVFIKTEKMEQLISERLRKIQLGLSETQICSLEDILPVTNMYYKRECTYNFHLYVNFLGRRQSWKKYAPSSFTNHLSGCCHIAPQGRQDRRSFSHM